VDETDGHERRAACQIMPQGSDISLAIRRFEETGSAG